MFEPGKLKEIVGEPVADAPLEVKFTPDMRGLVAWLETQDVGNTRLTRAAYPYWGDESTSTDCTYNGALSRARALRDAL